MADPHRSAGPPQGYAAVTWGRSLESGGKDALPDEIFVRDAAPASAGYCYRTP